LNNQTTLKSDYYILYKSCWFEELQNRRFVSPLSASVSQYLGSHKRRVSSNYIQFLSLEGL